jgi:hypothetical protein
MQRKYNHSGMGDGVYHDIEPFSTFNISGMGNVTLTNIGKGAIISKSGMGNLIITGIVGEDVTFRVSGMGNVKFTTRPPQSVISRFENSGMGNVNMPGGYSSPQPDNKDTNNYATGNVVIGDISIGNIITGIGSTHINNIQRVNFGGLNIVSSDGLVKVTKNGVITTYVGNNSSLINNQLFIDGKRVIESDPRIIHVENASRSSNTVTNNFGSTHSFIRSALPANQEENVVPVEQKPVIKKTNLLDDYSPATKAYIDSFKDKKQNTSRLKKLKLSDNDEKFLEDYLDPITANIINIPVMLNERLYDLDTLLMIQKKDKLDPFNKYEFTLRDIQPNRKAAEFLQKIVQQIKENHKTNLLYNNTDQPRQKHF